MLGSVGVVIGKTLYGDFDRRFQDWRGEGTDPSLRDSPVSAPILQNVSFHQLNVMLLCRMMLPLRRRHFRPLAATLIPVGLIRLLC